VSGERQIICEPVFAAVSPGNARSLRALLACGFTPIGSEVLLRPANRPTAIGNCSWARGC
jgi:RimJ/RimL family protein N-acetyltransferase